MTTPTMWTYQARHDRSGRNHGFLSASSAVALTLLVALSPASAQSTGILTHGARSELSATDLATSATTLLIPGLRGPEGAVLNAAGDTAFVTELENGELSAVEIAHTGEFRVE